MDIATQFTPISAMIGGALIGLSSLLLMAGLGRIAGISGIVGQVLAPKSDDRSWRIFFLLGLVAAPFLAQPLGWMPSIQMTANLPLLIGAGVLVGIGTQLGSGCTSGHGVCGISRLSTRSIIATLTFMASGALTVFVLRHIVSGS